MVELRYMGVLELFGYHSLHGGSRLIDLCLANHRQHRGTYGQVEVEMSCFVLV